MDNEKALRELEKKITLGFEKTYEKLAAFKKKHNSPWVVSRNGKVVCIPPDEISISKGAEEGERTTT